MIKIKVIKRDGSIEEYTSEKVANSILRAVYVDADTLDSVVFNVTARLDNMCSTSDIYYAVLNVLMDEDEHAAMAYRDYHNRHIAYCDDKTDLARQIKKNYTTINKDNANAANGSASSKMHSIAEAAAKEYNLAHMNPIFANNHRIGRNYIHDCSYRSVTFNCFFNPLGKMLEKGFNNGVGTVRSPKRIGSAVALACIILQSGQSDCFGGQGILNYSADLAPYAKKEYEYQKEQYCKALECDELDSIEEATVMENTDRAVYQAMEQFVYNANMMRSRAGGQTVFSSVNFGTETDKWSRMISKNLLKAYIAGLGKGENPIFPNLCYRVKKGVNLYEGDPNFDITKLAIECVGKRIQPRFVFCDSPAYDGMPLEHIGTMGCRTAVRDNINGDKSPDARGNLAFNTINLPFIALEAEEEAKKSGKSVLDVFSDKFDKIIDETIDELLDRYNVISHLKKRDIPFVGEWYQGHEGLKDDDIIEPMVKNGSLSIGFIGLAECLTVLIGKHHGESEEAQSLGLEIVGRIRTKADEAKETYHLNFSCFATPAESACYTLLKKVQNRFGKIKGVSDKEYLTNSFHLPVSFECDAKKKIDTEAPYHLLCNAGAIFYVETGAQPKFNPKGMLELIRYINNSGIVYGGINWEQDFCMDCGYQGSFDGNCPKCGSNKIKETKIITGYLSESWRFNAGKAAEAADRISHTGGAL